ncbi:MAG: cupin domain-containing protein [Defluviitaleaceae bacterium]|nr:cupin domain-containing protein [Defluviitaleaceae bacterium]MCL2274568.1 cupin domain-containing protein [Defluviitaleaceae bacterium]
MSGIIHTRLADISAKHVNDHAKYEFYKHAVTDSAHKYEVSGPREGNQTVTAFYVLPPGKANYPFHYHTVNEEVFYIISGSGELETFDGTRQITAGDIIVCPAGKTGAHKITNTHASENLVYLDVDTNQTPEIAYYPHTNKVGIRHGGMRDNFLLSDNVEYYEGEK